MEKTEILYEVKLDAFTGPLDLLLHLIRKHEIDIYDIPVSLITQQYFGISSTYEGAQSVVCRRISGDGGYPRSN